MFDASGLARIDAPDDQVRAFLQRYKGQAAGIEHLRLDAEVLDVRRDRVVHQRGRDGVGACHVVLARGVAQRHESVVGVARDGERLRLGLRLGPFLRKYRRGKQCARDRRQGGLGRTLRIYSLRHSSSLL